MKKKFILMLLLLSSCAHYVHTPQNRMISPETQGKFLAGAVELRTSGVKRDEISFRNNDTSKPFEGDSTVHRLGGMLDLGLLKRLDFAYVGSPGSSGVGILGLNFQFLGKPRNESRKGNFSSSLFLGYGTNHIESSNQTTDSGAFWNSNVKKLKYDISQSDVGLIIGYRWADKVLHYANTYVFWEEMKGNVTTNNNILNGAAFRDTQKGMIYSTGLVYDLGTAWYLKFDYSYMTSKWSSFRGSTTNALNAGIGAYW